MSEDIPGFDPFDIHSPDEYSSLSNRTQWILIGVLVLFMAGSVLVTLLSRSSDGRRTIVPATALSSEQVCALLTPAALEELYGRAFRRGTPATPTPSTGEPSDARGSADDIGNCTWSAKRGQPALSITIKSLAFLDATRTFEVLRPDLPGDAFEVSPPVGDEAFLLRSDRRATDPTAQASYDQSLVLRSDGVVLRVRASGAVAPEDSGARLADVARVAVSNLPPAA